MILAVLVVPKSFSYGAKNIRAKRGTTIRSGRRKSLRFGRRKIEIPHRYFHSSRASHASERNLMSLDKDKGDLRGMWTKRLAALLLTLLMLSTLLPGCAGRPVVMIVKGKAPAVPAMPFG